MNRFLIISLLPVVISGCGLSAMQKQQVSQFATATESIGVSSQQNFKQTRDKILEIEKRRLVMRNQKPPAKLDLDGGISVSGIATQITALDALTSYGKLLNELSSSNQSEVLGKAAGEFANSFESAWQETDASYVLSAEKKQAFEGAIQTAGSWFIERQKQKSLEKIVKAYTPEVNKLADLLHNELVLKGSSLCLERDNRINNGVTTGVIDHYCTSARALRVTSSFVLKSGGGAFVDRQYAYDSYVLSVGAIEEVRLLSENGNEAIDKFKKANNDLLASIESDDFSSKEIKAYAKQVKELNNLIKVLSK